MYKILVAFLFIVLVACDSQNEEELDQIGIVVNQTSCGGGIEPVFIVKLGEKDFIMTATLPKQFQKTNLKIQFKTKESTLYLYCTTDKVYPKQFDVYDVISL